MKNCIDFLEFLKTGGKYTGVVKDTYGNDIIIYTTYENGIPHGKCWSEDNKGNLLYTNEFKYGLREGIAIDYRNPSIIIKITYKNGKIISYTTEPI